MIRGPTAGIKIVLKNKKHKSISEACRYYGFKINTIHGRLRDNWTLEESFELKKKVRYKVFILNNKLFESFNAACKFYKMRQTSVNRRIASGWSLEEAFKIVPRKGTRECKGIVYCISNTQNKKVYVGYTTQLLQDRFKRHLEDAKNGSKIKFHKAIRKIGYKKFKINILAKTKNRQKLAKLEVKYIKEYNSIVKGYNTVAGGNGCSGDCHGKSIIFKGIKYISKVALADFLGIKVATLTNRIKNKIALDKPVKSTITTIGGITFKSQLAACRYYKVDQATVIYRLKVGQSLDTAFRVNKEAA